MRTWAPIGLGCLALLLGACGGGSSGLPTSLAHLYVYDAKAPLNEVDHGRANHNFPVRIRDVSFSDSKGGGADAYVCVPPGKGPFAGAVFVPGSGSGRVIHGVPELPDGLPGARAYRDQFEENVVTIRRAFDLLESRSDVDPDRLGLVGYSLGASLSSVVSGVDRRPVAIALIAPPSHAHFIPPFKGETATKAARILSPVDPKRYLRVAKAHLFLQMARFDQLLPANEQEDVIEAAGSGAKVKWYPTGHQMNLQTFTDTVQWVGDELHLGPLPKYARSNG